LYERPAHRVSASPAERAAVASGLPARVLVIDDEPNVRLFVCDLVEGLGYEADDAHDGGQGLALLERHRYGLVFTDLPMPNVSGWDVVNAVRARRPTMPIIMISGFATEDDMRQAREVGVPLLQKPFSVAEIQRVIRELLAPGASHPERQTESGVPRKPLLKAPEDRKLGGRRNQIRDNSGRLSRHPDRCSPRR
jgi:DNA-binding response OmpR family regulator